MTTGNDPQAESSPNEVEHSMDQTFHYLRRRGMLAVLVVHPFYKAFQQLSEDKAGKPVLLKLPPLLFLLIPLNVQFELKGDQVTYLFNYQRWLINMMKWILPKSRMSRFNSPKQFITDVKPRQKIGLIFLVCLLNILPFLFYLPWSTAGALFRSFSTTLWLALRQIPTLLAILLVVFITGDTWKIFGLEASWRFLILIVLITGITITTMLVTFKGWRTATGYSVGDANGDANLFASWVRGTPANPLN